MRIEMARRKWLPDNVTAFTDKAGRTRYRFRKKGYAQYLFRHEPGTEEFREELRKALNKPAPTNAKVIPGSFDALIESYYRSARWKKMAVQSRRTLENIIERWRAKHGKKPVTALRPRDVAGWMSDMAETPFAANQLRKTLNQLMRHAVLMGYRSDNPVSFTDPLEAETDGYYT